MAKRVFIIVLDSVGIGNAPDAERFGDAGTNTMATISRSPKFNVPNLRRLGLFNIDGVDCAEGVATPEGTIARLREASNGKDTTIGHWEIAGIISPDPLPVYPNGFPREFLDKFEKAVGHKTVCNLPYSGTEVIKDYGEQAMKNNDLIVYTSADSVFQIAANEAVVPLDELYEICRTARRMLNEEGHPVGRVIARPFVGNTAAEFKRTPNRHDFSLEPSRNTMLDFIQNAGLETIGVGKINDIFAGKGVGEHHPIKSNDDGMLTTIELAKRDFNGLAFVNLVDFDSSFGHRRDIDGYANALTEFDVRLGELLPLLREDDMLMITADHGCDPGYTKTTDHTRECVPLIISGGAVKKGLNLGTRDTYADIADTVCDALGVSAELDGTSIWNIIKK